ncbi:hypothetical protein V2G26_006264 [Clonostachys chloroleuca]
MDQRSSHLLLHTSHPLVVYNSSPCTRTATVLAQPSRPTRRQAPVPSPTRGKTAKEERRIRGCPTHTLSIPPFTVRHGILAFASRRGPQ